MITSPASKSPASLVMVELVASPAGTLTHATRGAYNFDATSSRVEAVSSPKAATSLRACSARSKPTTWWPCSTRRWVMFAPILPSPIMAIFMLLSSSCSARAADRAQGQGGGGTPPPRQLPVAQRVGLVRQGLHELVERLGKRRHPFGLEGLGHVLHVDARRRQPVHERAGPVDTVIDGPAHCAVVEKIGDGAVGHGIDGVRTDKRVDVGQVGVG